MCFKFTQPFQPYASPPKLPCNFLELTATAVNTAHPFYESAYIDRVGCLARDFNRHVGGEKREVALALIFAWTIAPVPWGVLAYGRHLASYGNRRARGIVKEADVPTDGTPDIFAKYVGEGLNGSVAVTKWTTAGRKSALRFAIMGNR